MLRIYWACGAEPPVDDATGLAGRAASMEIGAGLRMCAQRRCSGYPLRLGRLLQSRGMFRGLQTPAGLCPEFGLWSRGGGNGRSYCVDLWLLLRGSSAVVWGNLQGDCPHERSLHCTGY